MSRHQLDLVLCLKQPGTAVGRLCEKCDGKCPACDSLVNAARPARICDDCAFGSGREKCIICGLPGISDAYYCRECVMLERDRDGCPKVVNIGSSRSDMFFERKRLGR
ncbi:uncharacterized protein OGAPODRAFT_44644 [Ogataea polymorpha]|uniref:uncharacterized protein n=1 Tax=Ogataea polymorpha TaxID=460523 RepID=UPI0007F4D996|nr:uncharacterized protein OGAPODRAFT_44644 [Ogataea polymorpha]OBA18567.1 hypothetical protein OGAPODRAFT_44644 [Ogataea polymorpha]